MFIIRNILIADDEPNQLDILEDYLRKNFPKVNIITCSNGCEALTIIKEKDIDILITDIKMPILDGISLIKKIKDLQIPIEIVLISAYQEFSYAKVAIQCDVRDYITKPFRIKNIVKLINDINFRLCEKLKKENTLKQYKELENQYLINKRNRQINLVLQKSQKIESLDKELLNCLSTNGITILIRWKLNKSSRKSGYISSIQEENLLIKIKHIFANSYLVPIEATETKNEKIFVIFEVNRSEKEIYIILENLINEEKKIGVVFWCGISRIFNPLITNIITSYEEARTFLSFLFYYPIESKIFAYSDYSKNLTYLIPPLEILESKLHVAVQKSEIDKIKKILDEQFKEIERFLKCNPLKLKESVRLLVQRLNKDLYSIMNQNEYYYYINKNNMMFNECDSLKKLFKITEQILVFNCEYSKNKKNNYDILDSLIIYIQEHLDSDISLQTMAKKVHLSANYLSLKIKERTGLNYTNYINYLKIEKASELLLKSDLKVLDISKICGFNDSCYFNRVFRKKYSLSPEQYRKFNKNVN